MLTQSSAPLAIQIRPDLPIVAPTTRRAAANAFALVVAATAVSSSLLLPLSVLGVIACTLLFGLAIIGIGAGPLRAAFAEHAVQRARYARRDARERRLLPASSGYHALVELTRLVDDIEARDPELARRSDLEGLLDRHVALTIAHDRALRAAQMSDRTQLERIRDACVSDPGVNPKRLELCERRLRCLDDCEARAERYADELAILSDTIQLIAQHAACPDDVLADDAIEQRLAELDDNAAAHRQLAAELRG